MTRTCRKCQQAKEPDQFAVRTNDRGHAFRSGTCKKCENARPKKVDDTRLARQRARHRATAELARRHAEEFAELVAQYLTQAQAETRALAAAAPARHDPAEPVRLRPGARMVGESVLDRIDVARCRHCITNHDRGHVCPSCGAAPPGALKLPEDGQFDEVAVTRAMAGDPVRLTKAERAEVVRRLAGQGRSDAFIAARLHVTSRTVLRVREAEQIPSTWSA